MSYLDGISPSQHTNDITFFMEGLVEEARNLPTLLDLFEDFDGYYVAYNSITLPCIFYVL